MFQLVAGKESGCFEVRNVDYLICAIEEAFKEYDIEILV